MPLIALLLAAQVASGAAQPAPAAAAPSLLSEFQKFCVAHRGDLAAPIADADAQGFIAVPETMLSQLPAQITGVKARAKIGEAGAEFVFTGSGDLPSQSTGSAPTKANLCFTGAQGADYAATSADAAAWAKVPAYQTAADRTVYAFAETAGGRKALDPKNDAALAQAVKDRSATVVIVQSIPGGALLGYAVPTS